MKRYSTFIFSTWGNWLIILGATLLFTLYVLTVSSGERQFFLFYYYLPIGVPFVAYLLDRAKRYREFYWWNWTLEIPLIVVAFLRSQMPVPLVSGHALFLSYALLSTRSNVARLTAFLVLLEVIVLKIWAWTDPSLIGGILVGMTVALIQNRLLEKRKRVG